jgi:hypothetical protein
VGVGFGVHCRYHRVHFDIGDEHSHGVQVWHERQSNTPSKQSIPKNVHYRNADRIGYRRIALAAAKYARERSPESSPRKSASTVSGPLTPPCRSRAKLQDANHTTQIGSHLWSTI